MRCSHTLSPSQIVRSVKPNDKISAEACILKADCGSAFSVSFIGPEGLLPTGPNKVRYVQYSLVEYGDSISQIAGKDQWLADQSWDITLEKELQIPELLKSSAPQFPPPGYHNGHLLLHFNPNPNPKPEANTKASSVAVQIFVDHPLTEIRNKRNEIVKKVCLLARLVTKGTGNEASAGQIVFEDVQPTLSAPFTLFTRRREVKDNIPKPSDPVRRLEGLSNATYKRLMNLKEAAKNIDMEGIELPEKPIVTVGDMFKFMEERDERQLALISKKVLNRPQECLLALKQQLELRMIRDENDHRPRVWQAQGSTFKLFFPAMQGVTQLDLTPLSPRMFHAATGSPATNDEELRASMRELAVKDWYTDGHTNWDISEEFSNDLFMPDARNWKTKPVTTPGTSQSQPATAGAAPPAVAAARESPARQDSTAAPRPSSSSKDAKGARAKVTGPGNAQASVQKQPSANLPVARPSAGTQLRPAALNATTMPPRPSLRSSMLPMTGSLPSQKSGGLPSNISQASGQQAAQGTIRPDIRFPRPPYPVSYLTRPAYHPYGPQPTQLAHQRPPAQGSAVRPAGQQSTASVLSSHAFPTALRQAATAAQASLGYPTAQGAAQLGADAQGEASALPTRQRPAATYLHGGPSGLPRPRPVQTAAASQASSEGQTQKSNGQGSANPSTSAPKVSQPGQPDKSEDSRPKVSTTAALPIPSSVRPSMSQPSQGPPQLRPSQGMTPSSNPESQTSTLSRETRRSPLPRLEARKRKRTDTPAENEKENDEATWDADTGHTDADMADEEDTVRDAVVVTSTSKRKKAGASDDNVGKKKHRVRTGGKSELQPETDSRTINGPANSLSPDDLPASTGDKTFKDGQHPASSEGSGFKAEVASLVALVDRFKSCMQPASQQQSLPQHFKEAWRAVGHIKSRLEAKCFRVAFVGEAKGTAALITCLGDYCKKEDLISNTMSLSGMSICAVDIGKLLQTQGHADIKEVQMPDLSAFDATILVLDSTSFPVGSSPALPPWLSSIPIQQASKSLIAVDSCDAITICKRRSTEAELENLICGRLKDVDSFKNVNKTQIMLFSSEELQLFHAVAEKKVSVEDLRLASLLMWGRSAQLHPDEIHDDSLHARTLHNAGMSKTVTHLAKQLDEGPGKVMLENAVFKLESIVREVKNVGRAGLAALKKEAKELEEILAAFKYDPIVTSPDQGLSTLDQMLCSLNNDLSPQVLTCLQKWREKGHANSESLEAVPAGQLLASVIAAKFEEEIKSDESQRSGSKSNEGSTLSGNPSTGSRIEDLLTELEALVDTFRPEDVNLVQKHVGVLDHFIQQKLGADVEEASSLHQPPVANDGRAAGKFLALMVEDFKASFDKLFMEYCSLHGGLQFLSGPGKVFLEKSIKIQDRVTKWTESRTIARYTQALVAALEKPKLAGPIAGPDATNELLSILDCAKKMEGMIAEYKRRLPPLSLPPTSKQAPQGLGVELPSSSRVQLPSQITAAPQPGRAVEAQPLATEETNPLLQDQEPLNSEASVRESSPSQQQACTDCGTRTTPVWRRGPDGPKSLCNSCGVRYQRVLKSKTTSQNQDVVSQARPMHSARIADQAAKRTPSGPSKDVVAGAEALSHMQEPRAKKKQSQGNQGEISDTQPNESASGETVQDSELPGSSQRDSKTATGNDSGSRGTAGGTRSKDKRWTREMPASSFGQGPGGDWLIEAERHLGDGLGQPSRQTTALGRGRRRAAREVQTGTAEGKGKLDLLAAAAESADV